MRPAIRDWATERTDTPHAVMEAAPAQQPHRVTEQS